jgi:hypothetical protein
MERVFCWKGFLSKLIGLETLKNLVGIAGSVILTYASSISSIRQDTCLENHPSTHPWVVRTRLRCIFRSLRMIFCCLPNSLNRNGKRIEGASWTGSNLDYVIVKGL